MHTNKPAAELHRAALRFVSTGLLMLVGFFVLACLSACGGGGADQPVAGQCYVNGVASPAEACRPGATVQPVVCAASGACQ